MLVSNSHLQSQQNKFWLFHINAKILYCPCMSSALRSVLTLLYTLTKAGEKPSVWLSTSKLDFLSTPNCKRFFFQCYLFNNWNLSSYCFLSKSFYAIGIKPLFIDCSRNAMSLLPAIFWTTVVSLPGLQMFGNFCSDSAVTLLSGVERALESLTITVLAKVTPLMCSLSEIFHAKGYRPLFQLQGQNPPHSHNSRA